MFLKRIDYAIQIPAGAVRTHAPRFRFVRLGRHAGFDARALAESFFLRHSQHGGARIEDNCARERRVYARMEKLGRRAVCNT